MLLLLLNLVGEVRVMFRKNKTTGKRKGFVRRSIKSMFDVKRWVAWDDVKSTSKGVWKLGKDLFEPQVAEHHETFDEAVQRMQMTEKDILERKTGFLRLALIYLVMALALFIYTVYIFISGHFFTSILCLTLTVLILVYAYKEHFWYTQIKHRKFGLKFKEWLRFTLGKK